MSVRIGNGRRLFVTFYTSWVLPRVLRMDYGLELSFGPVTVCIPNRA